MNPDTNRFEALTEATELLAQKTDQILPKSGSLLFRPDGSPVPEHWSLFTLDEEIPIKGYVFRVSHIGESHLLLEPVGSFRELQKQRREERKNRSRQNGTSAT